jgi:hypothetical protein
MKLNDSVELSKGLLQSLRNLIGEKNVVLNNRKSV